MDGIMYNNYDEIGVLVREDELDFCAQFRLDQHGVAAQFSFVNRNLLIDLSPDQKTNRNCVNS